MEKTSCMYIFSIKNALIELKKGVNGLMLSLGSFRQGLSQDLETGCLKLAIKKLLGIQIFEGDHNTLRFQP